MSELKQTLINISEEKQAKITPENIKAGVQAFDVTGTFTADATATEYDIVKDKTAYVNGEKLIGKFENDSAGGNADIILDNIQASTWNSTISSYISNLHKSIIRITGTVKPLNSDPTALFYGCTSLQEVEAIDLSGATTIYYLFADCPNLTKVPTLINGSGIKTASTVFKNCAKLTEVPKIENMTPTNMGSMYEGCSSLKSIPYYSTYNVNNMQKMCKDCTSLVDVPQMDTSAIKAFTSTSGLTEAFSNCPNLSDASLNNILAMCAIARNASFKTLANVGLSQEQAIKCESLSNWAGCKSWGWSTGY